MLINSLLAKIVQKAVIELILKIDATCDIYLVMYNISFPAMTD